MRINHGPREDRFGGGGLITSIATHRNARTTNGCVLFGKVTIGTNSSDSPIRTDTWWKKMDVRIALPTL